MMRPLKHRMVLSRMVRARVLKIVMHCAFLCQCLVCFVPITWPGLSFERSLHVEVSSGHLLKTISSGDCEIAGSREFSTEMATGTAQFAKVPSCARQMVKVLTTREPVV